MPKNANKFVCELCDFKCCKNSNYLKHLETLKHKNQQEINKNQQNSFQKVTFNCNCGKNYKERSGLWRHKKVCSFKENPIQELQPKQEKNENLQSLIKDEIALLLNNHLVSTNETNNKQLELQKDMFQQIIEIIKTNLTTNNINNGQITNNNNYNQFNLNLYLNETCKNAMNVDQFIEYLQPTLQELEDTARLGYIEGITRIILRGLKDLEENERPFHCSDLKRETMFVKNNNDIWEKEPEEKPQLLKVVKAISRKNFCNVNAWQKEHPTWRNHDSKHNDQYNQILVNSTSGSTEEEQKNNYEKIIKNIIKETVIDKKRK